MDKVNLYITFGTIPALYAQINSFLDKTPSYVWVRSAGSYTPENKPDNLIYYHKFNCTDFDYLTNKYLDIVHKINEINLSQPNVKFSVFIDNNRLHFFLKPLIESGIYSHVENFILIPETIHPEDFFDIANENYFNDTKELWDSMIFDLENNKNIDEKLLVLNNYTPWFSTNNNVKCFVQHKHVYINLLNGKNIKYDNINLKEFDIEEKYLKLNTLQRNILFEIEYKALFNKNDKYLIIIGSYDFGDPLLSSYLYISLIEKLLDDLNSNYEVFYKPHPLYPTTNKPELEKFLYRHNIKILPSKMPLEIILWEYKNINVSGFASSINHLIDPSRTIAFFGKYSHLYFYRYLEKENKIKIKYYNIEISQYIAYALMVRYYKLHEMFNEKDESIRITNSHIDTIYGRLSIMDGMFNVTDEAFKVANTYINNIFERLSVIDKITDDTFRTTNSHIDTIYGRLIVMDGMFNVTDEAFRSANTHIFSIFERLNVMEGMFKVIDEAHINTNEHLNTIYNKITKIDDDINRINRIINLLLLPFKPILYIRRKIINRLRRNHVQK
jgi:hypothetical protein